MQKKYSAIVVGAGNIGALYDDLSSDHVLTHAHAYTNHPSFTLDGFVDADYDKALSAARRWGCKAYRTLSEACNDVKVDVVSVCVPDELHSSILLECAECDIAGGIIEKPLTGNFETSQKLLENTFFSEKPFVLNYSRRFLPAFQTLAKEIFAKNYGDFIGGHGVYGKGLIHNGSHAIDLLLFLGIGVENLTAFATLSDVYPKDPSHSIVVQCKHDAVFTLLAIDARYYTVFELELYFEKGKIGVMRSGTAIEIFESEESAVFSGHKYLAHKETRDVFPHTALYAAVEDLYACLTQKKKPICTIAHGYEVEKLCCLVS